MWISSDSALSPPSFVCIRCKVTSQVVRSMATAIRLPNIADLAKLESRNVMYAHARVYGPIMHISLCVFTARIA